MYLLSLFEATDSLNIFPHLKNIILLLLLMDLGCLIGRVSYSLDIKEDAYSWCTSTYSFALCFLLWVQRLNQTQL